MADPKNVIVDIKNGLSDVRQQMNLLKQDTAGWVSSLSSGVSRMSGGGSSGGGGVGSTLVAANPKFTPPAGSPGGGGGNAMVPYQPMGGNIVANTPPINPTAASNGAGGGGYTGNTNLTRFVGENPAAGALYAASLTSGMLDQPGESVESQLLTARAAYFNNFKNIGSAQAYNNMKGTIGDLSDKATITNKMDVQRGLAAAQSMGVSGPNITQAGGAFGSVAGGVAAASNLIPGQGFEGTMRAFGSMQQGRNVNMLRGIGIQIRDQDGNMKPPDQIIDALWEKICKDYSANYGAGAKPSKREMQIGLQPGNSMDSMLDMYFGNDPMAKQMVANGLLFKAETGGSAISKEKLQELGATTEAALASSNRASKATKQTMGTQDAGAKGYTEAANLLASVSDKITKDMLGPLQKITQANAYIMTLLGGANDTGSKALTAALGLGKGKLAGLGILATAGVAAGVIGLTDLYNGEDGEGPFGAAGGTLPYTDKKIASKTAKDTVYAKKAVNGKDYGGKANDISISNTNTAKGRVAFAKALLQELNIPESPGAINALVTIQEKEGGHWNNSAAFNPFNTKYETGAVAQLESGVKAYADWESGVAATAGTITGKGSSGKGFDQIKKALEKGDYTDIIASFLSSNWDGKEGGTNKNYGGLKGFKATNELGNTYYLGGVTLKIDGTGKSAAELYKEFQALLAQEELLKGATTK